MSSRRKGGVAAQIMFDRERGINVGEFEFPAYFNFFVLRKRVRAARKRIALRIALMHLLDCLTRATYERIHVAGSAHMPLVRVCWAD